MVICDYKEEECHCSNQYGKYPLIPDPEIILWVLVLFGMPVFFAASMPLLVDGGANLCKFRVAGASSSSIKGVAGSRGGGASSSTGEWEAVGLRGLWPY